MQFSFDNRNDQEIVGVYEPAHAPKGLAFVQHGFSGHRDQPHILVMAERFRAHHISTVRFDCTNAFGESEGDLSEANLTRHADDLEDMISWAEGQKWFEQPFYLAGHSLGGGSILRYAARYPEKVKAMAPLSAVISYEFMLEAYSTYKPDELAALYRDGYVWKESSTKAGKIGKKTVQYVEELKKYDFMKEVYAYRRPTLIAVGEKDDMTLPKHQKMLFDALPGPKMYREIEGSEHTFRSPSELAALGQIMDEWLESLS